MFSSGILLKEASNKMVGTFLLFFLFLPDPSQAHKWICVWLKSVDSTPYCNKHLGMNITGFDSCTGNENSVSHESHVL